MDNEMREFAEMFRVLLLALNEEELIRLERRFEKLKQPLLAELMKSELERRQEKELKK